MSEKKYDEDDGPLAPDRGGKKSEQVDYEKKQSSPIDQKDFDNDKTKMS